MIRAGLDLLKKRRDVFIVEGKAGAQQNIENDTTTPNVNLGPSIQLSSHHFRGCIVWTATTSFEEVAVRHDVTQTKIGNLDIEGVVEEQVLGLQITVDVSKSVQCINAEEHFADVESSMTVV